MELETKTKANMETETIPHTPASHPSTPLRLGQTTTRPPPHTNPSNPHPRTPTHALLTCLRSAVRCSLAIWSNGSRSGRSDSSVKALAAWWLSSGEPAMERKRACAPHYYLAASRVHG